MIDADEKRRRAITEWWEGMALRDFIARMRARRASRPNQATKGDGL